VRRELREQLKSVQDLERIGSKTVMGQAMRATSRR